MTRYTLGFCFDTESKVVALIKKHRGISSPNCPEWMEGKLNGIGGKEGLCEPTNAAHLREFHEETTGATIRNWKQFATMVGKDRTWAVSCFAAFNDDVFKLRTPDGADEKVIIFPIHHVFPQDLVENVRWLIPMALEKPRGVIVCEI